MVEGNVFDCPTRERDLNISTVHTAGSLTLPERKRVIEYASVEI
jgi:hypothetical protein